MKICLFWLFLSENICSNKFFDYLNFQNEKLLIEYGNNLMMSIENSLYKVNNNV